MTAAACSRRDVPARLQYIAAGGCISSMAEADLARIRENLRLLGRGAACMCGRDGPATCKCRPLSAHGTCVCPPQQRFCTCPPVSAPRPLHLSDEYPSRVSMPSVPADANGPGAQSTCNEFIMSSRRMRNKNKIRFHACYSSVVLVVVVLNADLQLSFRR